MFVTFVSVVLASKVIDATDKTFDEIIGKPGVYSFVEFYAPWCGHCKQLAPIWEQLAELYAPYSDQLQIVRLDADANREIGGRYRISGFPTLKMFNPGDKIPRDYQGGREMANFVKFLEYATGIKNNAFDTTDYVTYMSDDDLLDTLKGKHGIFAITASWCGYCKQLKPIWSELAKIFKNDKDQLIIGDVVTTSVTADNIVEKFNVQSFPTIIYIDPSDEYAVNPEIYSGGRSIDELLEFINSKTHINRDANGRLFNDAGKIDYFDSKLQILFKKPEFLAQLISDSESNKELQNANDEYSFNYYLKLLRKLQNNEGQFFATEHTRLLKMLQKKAKSIKPQIQEKLAKRLNILKGFVDAQDSSVKKDEL